MIISGARAMLPITVGIIPFGLVMGTVCSGVGLNLLESVGLNFIVFAGASQLAALDLMTQNVPSFVVIVSGLIINLRFILYSASFSQLIKGRSWAEKIVGSYLLTDQSYAVLAANEKRFTNKKESLLFYIGASLCMITAWHLSVVFGVIFGNFAPKALSLDFAIPLSFMALIIPTLKNKNYFYVAVVSGVLSVFLKPMPFNLGLLTSGAIALTLGTVLSRRGAKK